MRQLLEKAEDGQPEISDSTWIPASGHEAGRLASFFYRARSAVSHKLSRQASVEATWTLSYFTCVTRTWRRSWHPTIEWRSRGRISRGKGGRWASQLCPIRDSDNPTRSRSAGFTV